MFLSLTGTYQRSRWLGLPLDRIAANAGPSAAAPRPLVRLLEILGSAEALATPGLFIDSTKAILEASGHAIPGVAGSGTAGGRGGCGTPTGGSLQVGYGVRRSTQRALIRSLAGLIEILERDPDTPLPKVWIRLAFPVVGCPSDECTIPLLTMLHPTS